MKDSVRMAWRDYERACERLHHLSRAFDVEHRDDTLGAIEVARATRTSNVPGTGIVEVAAKALGDVIRCHLGNFVDQALADAKADVLAAGVELRRALESDLNSIQG